MKLVCNSGAALFVFSVLLLCPPFCRAGHAGTVRAKNTQGRETAKIIAAVEKDGVKVSIKALTLDYSAVEVRGEGFKPYESLYLLSTSCHEALQFPVAADKHGKLLPMGLAPGVVGQLGGMCRVAIVRTTGFIQVQFPWGIEALKMSLKGVADEMARYGRPSSGNA